MRGCEIRNSSASVGVGVLPFEATARNRNGGMVEMIDKTGVGLRVGMCGDYGLLGFRVDLGV